MINTPSIPGYQIRAELYNGIRTLVYRAVREIDNLPVVIKLLKNPYPSFLELVQFRNQYTIAKNLHSPGIIQTYSLEPYQNGYVLVMEDFGGISLSTWRKKEGKQCHLREFLEIAISLCETLDVLIRDRIIHKDIKPANILINPETKQIKLIDFSIASLLPRETQSLISANVLEGTLAYMSPEQTGRMNRVIDYRTDFYSLGVTFYELLTGELPFQSSDAMELLHCHIAKIATLVHEINPQIPAIISEIIAKLLAKNAEDRYQSALGLKFDLEKCWLQLQETGRIESFPIAKKDVCDRFIIPDKLYGREAEIDILLQSFTRVSQGATEMMLVAGFSGIGKTAVVNEVHKPIVKQRGYFIKGKFDQFNRNVPFSAFVQAFRDLMGHLITESDVQIQAWKEKILEALGGNSQVVIEVIPELESIIGKQPPARELSGIAAQHRFNLLFQKFVQVFTTKEHPLVIFLDDLQWADAASLKLIQLLMLESWAGYLLLICAYRDNEVSPAHPFMLILNEIYKGGAKVNNIILNELNGFKLNQLVADTLKCTENLALPLSRLVLQKTQGNPFFATQFLKALHQDDLIQFNYYQGHWQCDIAQVTQQALTDDVVEFMTLQLRKLPREHQDMLKLAACIGNQFDLEILAIVAEKSEVETAAYLWKSLQERLILPTSEIYKFYLEQETHNIEPTSQILSYKFLHDRIQQAAYALIPEGQKRKTHLQIGRSLLQKIPANKHNEYIFDIVNQLNLSRCLIDDISFRIQLAELNLVAGKKAKSATAYGAAIEYSLIGLEFLGADSWQQQYQLTLELHELAAEAAYLNGNLEQMQKLIGVILESTTNLLDKIFSYEIQITSSIVQSKQLEAIQTARSILGHLGIHFPEQPTSADIQQGLQQVIDNLQGRPIAELVHLPVMTTSEHIAAMKILMRVIPAAFQSDPAIVPLITFAMVQLSMKHGNTHVSAYGYSLYGLLLCGAFGDIDAGCEFGKLAVTTLSQFNSSELKAKILTVVNAHVAHWQQHINVTLTPAIEGYTTGLETGDLEYAGYCAYIYCVHSFWLGRKLEPLQQEMTVYIDSLRQIKQQVALNWNSIYQQTVLNLQVKSDYLYDLIGTAYDERKMLPLHQQAQDLYTINHLFINKLLISYLFHDYNLALQNAEVVEQSLGGVTGLVVVSLFYFYDSLVRLALYPTSIPSEQTKILDKIHINLQKIEIWANHAPMNYLHKLHLVNAEKYRVLGYRTQAIEYYDRAIAGAKEQGFIQEEALANELAAKFYLEWGKEKVAVGYMQAAYYCYAHWGAKAKTDDLEKLYPDLLRPIVQSANQFITSLETIVASGYSLHSASINPSSSTTSINQTLDFATLIQAAQTISSTIELDELMQILTRMMLENAGAEKCVLLLSQEQNWQVRAITTLHSISLQNTPWENNPSIPHKLIQYVKHTQETVVIDNLNTNLPVIGDYLTQHQPKSLLCLPILNQGQLVGILYLENRLTSGVFTSDRILMLNFLCSQAAISLKNAHLYAQQQEKAQELAAKEAEYRSIFESVNDGLSITDLETGKIIATNPITFKIYGYTQEEWLNLTPSDFLHPDFISLFNNYLETLRAGQEFYTQCIAKHKNGSFFDIEVKAVPFLYKGKWHGLTILRDISEQQAALRERQKAEDIIIHKSQALEQALQDLQQAQLQIIQSEKMSALGNLVAGVAHEMNNPLGFLAASLKQAKPTFLEIAEHLKLYQDNLPNPSAEILEHAEEIDLDYTLEDLPKLIDAMVMACDRLKNISTSLRTFSRADKDYKVPFNIHEGIDSTILILKHRLKANEQRPAIEVITEYGNLPQIDCFPGQLNQVFMNILANAIDALEEVNSGRSFAEIQAQPNQIKITTAIIEQGVKIAIADNGPGIPADSQHKIFDHLYTTKAVGKGTGLGLAIAQQIVVEKHGGVIEVNSQLGEGTEFVIELPL